MKTVAVKRLVVGIAGALAVGLLPAVAVAQCEGGTTVAGYYLRDGSYVLGRCATTNLQTPGQLYPSGAQPAPSTNPGLAVSRLPGQPLPTGLIPTGGTDVWGQLSGGGALTGGQFVTSAGPGAAPMAVGALGNILGGNAYQGGLLPAGTGATPASGLLPGRANAFNAPGAVPGTGVVSGVEASASVRLPAALTSAVAPPAVSDDPTSRAAAEAEWQAWAEFLTTRAGEAAAEAERLTNLANEPTPPPAD